ncbi:MAG: ATP-grasp domain-containing protein [Gemmataceae bacterium]
MIGHPISKEISTLIIVGASTRAAAFSALRAGRRPWCLDLFADADLRARCPVEVIALDEYPLSLPARVAAGPPGPWMYTGGLENHPKIVRRISRDRPLLGHDADVLRLVRDPLRLADLFRSAGVPYPEVRLTEPNDDRMWLAKPRAGAGGAGIHVWKSGDRVQRRAYFQEFLTGPSCAALYDGPRLLGVTEQLVGEPWLAAGRFHYCGSIGPISLTEAQRIAFERIGHVLAGSCHLHGLFGVDFIQREGEPLPVEVNPRYTASAEVLEYAAGGVVGKAILFARKPLTFPADGPWLDILWRRGPIHEMPAFADIPAAGQVIAVGWPILTLLTREHSVAECHGQLRTRAGELERWLYRA